MVTNKGMESYLFASTYDNAGRREEGQAVAKYTLHIEETGPSQRSRHLRQLALRGIQLRHTAKGQ